MERQAAGQMRLDLQVSDVWEKLPAEPRRRALEICASMILVAAIEPEGVDRNEP